MSSPHKQWHLNIEIGDGGLDSTGDYYRFTPWSKVSFDIEQDAIKAEQLFNDIVRNANTEFPMFETRITTPPVKNPNKIRHDRTSMMAPQEIAAAKELKDKVMM